MSHHHGIGKLRSRFLKEIKSDGALNWTKEVKKAVDPQNIFGCGNQLLENDEEISINQYPIPDKAVSVR